MSIRAAYASHKEIRFEIIMAAEHVEVEGLARPTGLVESMVARGQTLEPENRNLRRAIMREWHKPTVEETESGMEVTSYLPAELDRA
jgi:coenzyme PQQ precursor peptide PqqA